MPLPLLQTKLYVPPRRPYLVARPEVTAKLRFGDQPLTLIAAPAGFGKTTLVSEWIAQAGLPAAWLSLDDDDNDPSRFFAYLVTALHTVHNQVGETALSLLDSPQPPATKALLTQLINELSRVALDFTLVLDDYHLITAQPIHEALMFLIEHLPPAMHLVITSRIDPPFPLARWRARPDGWLRADDLRFSNAEATTFLNQVMGLQLTAADIAALETRTEGWIAGLQLAALSMQGREDVAGFVQAFSGSHRHVLSYLVEEVLDRCPPGTLEFLLQTAILERLNADLCDAVTARSDSQTLLARIERANLFLVPLDDEGNWYRYHHLFAEVLRSRLQLAQPEAIGLLHQRASAWHEQQALWSEAIHHALAAGDFAQAAQLIERVGIALFAQSNIQHSLQRWLATLPVAFIRARPRLCLMYGWIRFAHADTANALHWVAAAEAALSPLETQPTEVTGAVELAAENAAEIAAEALAMRAVLSAYDPNVRVSEALAYGRQALATLNPAAYSFRGMAAAAMGMAYVKQGNVLEAEAAMAEANRMGRAAGNLYMLVAFAASQITMQRARGLLRQALACCHENLAWLLQQGAHAYPTFGGLYATLADLLREQNDLDVAQRYAEMAITHSDQELNPATSVFSRLVFTRIKQAQGDWAQVWAQMGEVSTLAEQHPEVLHTTILPAMTAQFQLAERGFVTETAWAWAQSSAWEEGKLLGAFRFNDFVCLYEHSRIARAQVLLAGARSTSDRPCLHDTLAYLQRQQAMAAASNLGWYLIKLHLLQALVYRALGEMPAARNAVTEALRRAEPEGFVRIFVDEGEPLRLLLYELRSVRVDLGLANYLEKLLAAFESSPATRVNQDAVLPSKTPSPPTSLSQQSPVRQLIEPLSAREQEVLQLIAAGLTNGEIACKLVVTVGTVKSHINHIFSKFAVKSRTQAVARRESGLLTD